MNVLSTTELKTLAEARAHHCVSIYMPTHRGAAEIQQDPIRLRNLLGEAEKRLAGNGLRPAEARRLLAPADVLTSPHNFWQQQADGLAVFLAPDHFSYYRLPFAAEELLVIGRRFHLQPLLPLLRPDGRFFILALSQNQVRLLEGTRHTVREIDLEGVPQSLAEALRYDEREPQLQFHTGSRAPGGRGGERPGVYHGQGPGGEGNKTDILRYFHQVDDGLREWLGPSVAPLVLAGVEYLHPLYREANTYPYLVEPGLKGNPEDLRPEQLHELAWEIVRPQIIARREAGAAQFRQLQGAGNKLATSDLKTIVPAASFGRVESLWVLLGRRQWGTLDPATNDVELHDEKGPDDEDLLDLAAVQTYLFGGSVYAVTADKMPVDGPVAALLRY